MKKISLNHRPEDFRAVQGNWKVGRAAPWLVRALHLDDDISILFFRSNGQCVGPSETIASMRTQKTKKAA
jgi:hypothetical protein